MPAISRFKTEGASMADQTDWRYCGQCHGLFFDGYPDKGRCPAGGGHAAIGYNFVLPHDISETPTGQASWRYCNNCHGLFFDGYPDKGRCPAGGGHAAIGYNFVLPHGVTPPMNVAVRYRGLICFGETDSDQGSNSDEPYVIVTTVSANGATNTIRSQVYQDVDGGESRPDEVEVFRGPAYGLTLGVVLMENDEGDPNKYRGEVEAGVRTAAGAIAAAVTAVGGPLVGGAVAAILQKFAPEFTDAINDLLGTGDDQLGTDTIVLDADRLTVTARADWLNSRGVSYKVESKLLSGDGASYKAYFDVIPV